MSEVDNHNPHFGAYDRRCFLAEIANKIFEQKMVWLFQNEIATKKSAI